MNKRSDGKRRRSKRSKRCRSLLGKKIGINIREGIYANKAQAIAVAYSQVRKRYPSCRRILRSKKSRKSKKSKRRRRINDGVTGTGSSGFLNPSEQETFRNLFSNSSGNRTFQTITFEIQVHDNSFNIGSYLSGETAVSGTTQQLQPPERVTLNNVIVSSGHNSNIFNISRQQNQEQQPEYINISISKIFEYQLDN
jgi:hypothetical protein